MMYLCECRGPCRRSIELTLDTYSWLRAMGTVIAPECAEREDRIVLFRYNGKTVVANTRERPNRPSAAFATFPP